MKSCAAPAPSIDAARRRDLINFYEWESASQVIISFVYAFWNHWKSGPLSGYLERPLWIFSAVFKSYVLLIISLASGQFYMILIYSSLLPNFGCLEWLTPVNMSNFIKECDICLAKQSSITSCHKHNGNSPRLRERITSPSSTIIIMMMIIKL